jgi:hypothetical protein
VGQVYQVFAKVDFTNRVAIRTLFETDSFALGRATLTSPGVASTGVPSGLSPHPSVTVSLLTGCR